MDKSATMSAWTAEEVKNWTQALVNIDKVCLNAVRNDDEFWCEEVNAIKAKIRSLLGIADDK